jgi:hypothetical protein
MSLIQDALKRQQEEMNKKAGVTPPPVPPGQGKPESASPPPAIPMPKIPLRMMNQPAVTGAPPAAASAPPPPPIPPPPTADKIAPEATEYVIHRDDPEGDKRNQTLLVATLAIMVLLLAAGLYWAWPLLFSKLSGDSAAALPSGTAAAAQPTNETSMTAHAGALLASNGPAVAVAAAAVQADTNETSVLPPEAVPTASETLALPVVRDDPQPALFTPTTVSKTDAGPISSEPVIWPAIKVTGMVKLGGTAAALINSRVVAPGESIEDVKLLSVNKDGALLQFKHEERLLRVGETAR